MKKLVFVSYGVFLILFSAFSFLFIDSNFVYLKDLYTGFYTNARMTTAILYSIFLTVFFAFYIYFIYTVKNKVLKKKDISQLIAISVICLILSYPAILSYDIFNYSTTSKVLFGYMENPYIIMPVEFPNEPFLLYTHAANKVALYGPLWLIFSGIPYFFGLGNVLLTVFGFKIITTFCYIFIIYSIWKLTKSMESVVIFGLNPLVLIETLVSGHNDVVMLALVFGSLFLFKEKKVFLAVLLFIFSIFIKYATIFLIPVYIYLLWKYYKKDIIDFNKIYIYSTLFMFVIFILSPLREEIYPWYFIWVLPFAAMLPSKRKLLIFSVVFSFCLMLRYIPFMAWGNHLGITPLVKNFVTILPLILFSAWSIFPFFKKKYEN